MPVTSYNKETNRYLTNFGRDAKPGDIITWSVGHPLGGGEFTTIRLGQIVTIDNRSDAYGYFCPLFDTDECDVLLSGYEHAPETMVWAPRTEIKEAKELADKTWEPTLTLHGVTFCRSPFSGWCRK